MSRYNNKVILGAVAAATAGGYYLYSSGGNAKVAQKQVECKQP
jgi:hypothetical protein